MPSPDTVRLITCVGVQHDLALLPHFLRHYLALGVRPDRVHVVLHDERAGTPELARAHALLAAHDVEAEEEWIAPYTSDAMWAKRREVQRRVARPDDWVLSADVDELQEYPEPLHAFLERCERRGVDCVQGAFIDRLAPDGRLADVAPEPSIWEQFPVEADVACTLRQGMPGRWRGGTVNLMAVRGRVLPSRGGHDAVDEGAPVRHFAGVPLGRPPWITRPAVRFAVPLRVHHFKWTGTLERSTRRRLATPGVSPAGKTYGELLLDYLDRHEGRLDPADLPVRRAGAIDRVPWRARAAALAAAARLTTLLQNTLRRLLRWKP